VGSGALRDRPCDRRGCSRARRAYHALRASQREPASLRRRALDRQDPAGPAEASASDGDDARFPYRAARAGKPAHTRLLFERHIYTATAAVILIRPETDGDFHLVLTNGTGR
jgi:hypothetical protein